MAIRINAIPPNGFRHSGLVVGKAWQDVGKLDEKQRTTLRDFHGRHIRIHPNDVAKLSELGLAFDGQNKPLKDSTAKKPGPANSKNDAPRGDEKKER
jgi:hypothetical protein